MSPPLRRAAIALAVFAVIVGLELGLEPLVPDSSIRQLLMLAAVNVIVALSLNVINGMAGQFSIGHAGFVGIGAYTARDHGVAPPRRRLGGGERGASRTRSSSCRSCCRRGRRGGGALRPRSSGLPEPAAPRRLPRDRHARLRRDLPPRHRDRADGRRRDGGISRGAIASLGGQNGYAGPRRHRACPLYAGPFWVFGARRALTVVAWRIKFSGWGRALRALREDEIAAAAVGVDPTRYKVTSFVIAAVRRRHRRRPAGASMRDGIRIGAARSVQLPLLVRRHHDGHPRRLGQRDRRGRRRRLRHVHGQGDRARCRASTAVQALQHDHPWLDLNALRMVVYAAVLIGLMILRPEGLFGERELVRGAAPSAKGGRARARVAAPPRTARSARRRRHERTGALDSAASPRTSAACAPSAT